MLVLQPCSGESPTVVILVSQLYLRNGKAWRGRDPKIRPHLTPFILSMDGQPMLPSIRVPSGSNAQRGRGRYARLVVDQSELSAPSACIEAPQRILYSHSSALNATSRCSPSWAPMQCGLVSAFIRPPARRLTRDWNGISTYCYCDEILLHPFE